MLATEAMRSTKRRSKRNENEAARGSSSSKTTPWQPAGVACSHSDMSRELYLHWGVRPRLGRPRAQESEREKCIGHFWRKKEERQRGKEKEVVQCATSWRAFAAVAAAVASPSAATAVLSFSALVGPPDFGAPPSLRKRPRR